MMTELAALEFESDVAECILCRNVLDLFRLPV